MRDGTCGRCLSTPRRRGRRTVAAAVAAVVALVLPAAALAEPDFQLLVSPGVVELASGGETTLEVGVGAIDGFASPVQLSVSGLPAGVTAQFSVNPVTPSGISRLVLRAEPGTAPETVTPVVTGTGGGKTHAATGRETTEVRLLRVCRGTIVGTARDEVGAPLPGVEVRESFGPDTFGEPDAITGADGRYRIEDVSLQGRNADRQVSVFGNLLPDYWWGQAEGTVGCGRTTQLDLTLVRVRPARLLGTVFVGHPDPADYDRVIPTTTPAAGVTTLLDPLEDPLPIPFPIIVTGADGRYDFRFPVRHGNAPLSTWLEAFTEGGSDDEWRSGYWFNSLALPDVQPGEVLERDIAVVEKCTFALTGRVVDAITSLPLAGASLNVGTAEDFDTATSGADGSFSFPRLLLGHNNAPTEYFAGASLLGYESTFESDEVTACGDDQDVTLRLTPREYYFGTLEGIVRDEETRAPLAGITVFLAFATMRCGTPPKLEARCEAVTDAAGRYRIGPILSGHEPDDVYHAFVRTSETPPPAYYDESANAVIGNGATTTLDFDLLRRRFATVAGPVSDVITGQAIAGARVVVADRGELSGADGAYSVGGLHLGFRNASTQANAQASASGYWPRSVKGVPLVADTTTPVSWELMPLCQDATISGRVLDEETGAPIATATVRVGSAFALTDANGNFEATGVEVGNATSPVLVTVTASKNFEYFAASTDVTVFCGLRLTVTPPPATGSVSVRKTVSGAAPPAGRTFPFRLRRGASPGVPGMVVAEASAPAADGGPALFAGLQPGPYQLCEVVPAGWASSLTGFTLAGGEVCSAVTVSAGAGTAIDVNNTPPPTVDPPPTCVMTEQGALPDGRGFVRFRAQDVGSGLASYAVLHVRNATVSVDNFSVGTLGPVTVTATGVTLGRLAVTVEFLDLGGSKAVCDPIVHVVARADGQLQEEIFTGVPQAESKVTILNGDPGMSKVRLAVNGIKFKEYELTAGEVRKFDVAAAMKPGNDNTITVSVRGKKGATAVIVIADID